MYHFVALVWIASDAGAGSVASNLRREVNRFEPRWTCSIAADGLIVYSQPPKDNALQEYRLPGAGGVVLGRLFPADLNATHKTCTVDVSSGTAAQTLETRAKSFTERYWGGYVAFFRTADGEGACVLRDCSGKIPCYRTEFRGVHIVFSDVTDLQCLPLPPFSITGEYVAAFIRWSELQVRRCGLREVTELLAGDCFEIRHGSAHQRSLWNPCTISRTSDINTYGRAIQDLRNTTERCVNAWSTTYDPVLLSLSGGLDSAIVLGCLGTSDRSNTVVCVNFFGENSGEDERQYARAAARRYGVSLIERKRDADTQVFDSRLLRGPLTAKPTIPPILQKLELDLMNQIATETGASAVWTGQGGDHLFFQTSVSLGAADYFSMRGVGRGLIGAVVDAARLSRTSYWSVLRNAWTITRPKARWLPQTPNENGVDFVNRDALPRNIDEFVSHPWVQDLESLPRGKAFQISLIAEVLNRQRPLPRLEYAHEHHPLLSQPILESCLHIPTFFLTRGGRQRALAREAFDHLVPREILNREDKGDTTSMVIDRIRRSEPHICELLLDGQLVRDKIISRVALEPYLLQRRPFCSTTYISLLACIAAEVWMTTWTTRRPSAAA
jgi:asparagine synthase (glutamine-hydrolysing)